MTIMGLLTRQRQRVETCPSCLRDYDASLAHVCKMTGEKPLTDRARTRYLRHAYAKLMAKWP